MTDRWTITLMGENQSLILETLSDMIVQYQGNWLDSRLAQMDGKFVGIISASIPKKNSGKLQDELESFADEREIVMLVTINGFHQKDSTPIVSLKISAEDRRGIVLDLANILRDQHLIVREFNTHMIRDSQNQSRIFSSQLVLELPEPKKSTLIDAIQALGKDFLVDIERFKID